MAAPSLTFHGFRICPANVCDNSILVVVRHTGLLTGLSNDRMAMRCARQFRAVRGVDGNGSVNAAHRSDQSQSIDDTIVQ